MDITNNGLPILNIDTYPGVYYKKSAGTEYKRMDDTYNTMVHEYQHLINYSNTNGMNSWLNECFSAAAEEICYPGSSVIGRMQSWENYYYSDNDDWLNPPTEFQYQSSNSLHTGYSMYAWSNSLDNTSLLTLYSQVSFFAQYLFTRFGNTIYKQISNKYSSSETSAITSATGVNVADLVRDFRIALYANAAESLGTNYGFKPQAGYDPSQYHDVQNPYDLLAPVVFTGSSCSIKGGGAICVKPVGGVYNPPSGASSSLKYYGISFAAPYTVTATSNNTSYGTVSVSGTTITATPANGYYVESCTLVSGTATWTINGNTISVSPTSDCTIRVNFAAKPTYTVNYIASGAAEGSVTAYLNDAVTLPASVSVNPDGWTFSGWVAAQLEETTDKPAFYAPGASYTVTCNATLYALYTRVEEGEGEAGYQLVTELQNGGKYIIIDSNSISGTSGYAVGNTIVASNHYLNAVSVTVNSDNTCTVTSANEAKVVWVAASSGNGFTFYNEAVGKYMGLDSSEYLYPSSTALAWAYTSDKYLDNQTDSEGYYYLSFDTTNTRYTTNKSGKVINLYQYVTGDTTYYTTDPVVAAPTYYTVTFKDWDGTVLSTQQVLEGTAATAPADPTRTGYTFTGWDVAFNNITADTVVTATYTINSYKLTINYVDTEGNVVAPKYEQNYNYGASYSVASPVVEGYAPDIETVTGTMGTADVTVTVTYSLQVTLLGDVDCNGVVDMRDVTALNAYLVNCGTVSAQGLVNANVSGGALDAYDSTMIAMIALGLSNN